MGLWMIAARTLTQTLSAPPGLWCISIMTLSSGFPADFDVESSTGLGTEIIAALTLQINAKTKWANDSGSQFFVYFK